MFRSEGGEPPRRASIPVNDDRIPFGKYTWAQQNSFIAQIISHIDVGEEEGKYIRELIDTGLGVSNIFFSLLEPEHMIDVIKIGIRESNKFGKRENGNTSKFKINSKNIRLMVKRINKLFKSDQSLLKGNNKIAMEIIKNNIPKVQNPKINILWHYLET